MDHDFIQALVDLYKELPEADPELAARRVAVLIEGEIQRLEQRGTPVSRSSLLAAFNESLAEYKKAA